MGIALMFLLALYQMQAAIHSEIIESPQYNLNALSDDIGIESKIPNTEPLDALLIERPEQTELEFRYPISAIGVDYAKNSLMLRFQKYPPKLHYKYDPDWDVKRKSLQDNFMHFGKRQAEEISKDINRQYFEDPSAARFQRSLVGSRDSRGDNFMRFGRRSPQDDFMRFGRSQSQAQDHRNFLRFGRPDNFMRFGRSQQDQSQAARNFLRFGRPDNFMRFGRSPQQQSQIDRNFLRFGRPDNFMRFGRAPPPQLDSNFMRFGKSVDSSVHTGSNQTKPQLQKNEIKAAVKLLNQSGTGREETNPVDKAITMLFSKQQQQREVQEQPEDPTKSSEQESTDLGNGNNLDGVDSVEQYYGYP
ncbi:FMRFamide-related peptides [Scaptodrosophila lebanonensis]|uniref:FMRFamide-related peptides n=1 Tax=Drosophila lebanonensis TaxID=7225 RepID=A0A6J2UFF1_DROLE|nr:FMRFamide-related peptides [Scaptodrosophila lebanonensis]XP_030387149.1 FMRFamide-related peptides [Scaptodrosophila lebanonensis]